MDINEIMKLIQAVSDYGLTSFELEEGNIKIALKREKETVVLSGAQAQQILRKIRLFSAQFRRFLLRQLLLSRQLLRLRHQIFRALLTM